jgi:hypothetical protein
VCSVQVYNTTNNKSFGAGPGALVTDALMFGVDRLTPGP